VRAAAAGSAEASSMKMRVNTWLQTSIMFI
jgi:hypothetical protein